MITTLALFAFGVLLFVAGAVGRVRYGRRLAAREGARDAE